jgi:hypothetical protein
VLWPAYNNYPWKIASSEDKVVLSYGEKNMRFGLIGSQFALIAAFQLASGVASISASAQQSSPSQSKPQESDRIRLSTSVVKAWREIPVGSPVYALDDAVTAKDWLHQALIQRIDFQSGIWYIRIEPGYSVFRIYPYTSKTSLPPMQGIVLKVNGTLSEDELIAAIQKRTAAVKVDEYDIFAADTSLNVQRYSRHHDKGGR